MYLKITIVDENEDILDYVIIDQDGSDSEASNAIRDNIRREYETVADPEYDEFECMNCHKTFDIDDSIEIEDELYCPSCAGAEE